MKKCHYILGTITNPGPRRSITALVYLRALLYLPELGWACLGAVWVSDDSKGCDPATVGAVIAAVVARSVTQTRGGRVLISVEYSNFYLILYVSLFPSNGIICCSVI